MQRHIKIKITFQNNKNRNVGKKNTRRLNSQTAVRNVYMVGLRNSDVVSDGAQDPPLHAGRRERGESGCGFKDPSNSGLPLMGENENTEAVTFVL